MEKLKDIWKLSISTATEYFNILQSKYVDIYFNRVDNTAVWFPNNLALSDVLNKHSTF